MDGPFYVDDRTGCCAVRLGREFNSGGLHPDSEGVVKYWKKELVESVCDACGHVTPWWEDAGQLNEATHLRDMLNALVRSANRSK